MLRRTIVTLVLASALLVLRAPAGAAGDPPTSFPVAQDVPLSGRRINAPYFPGDIRFSETAVAWFGQVTGRPNSEANANAGDVRVGYNGEQLYVRCGAFDRWLWYDTTPSAADLTNWDAFTLYLDLGGNAGSTLDANSYRFDGQLVWWGDRANYQAAYRGGGGTWASASIAFDTESSWNGNAPNDTTDDRGWSLAFTIPFTSLGLSGPPAEGTVWGMAVVLHDRDDAAGTAIPDQSWPETTADAQPATWGQLHFGIPSYEAPQAVARGTVMVRDRVNGATVIDAHVGGGTDCGDPAGPGYFPTWGALNYYYRDRTVLNVQNLGPISEWPCFSRIYVTFPLDALPANKVVISATLTMYQFGNAGAGADPQPSLIQVLTVDQDWDEATITWNNSPMAVENVSSAWADVFPTLPGEPREWDLSRTVAGAYAAGTPLRLALYESDWAYHSGKYFRSSEMNEYEAYMRPTLRVAWGDPVAAVKKTASPSSGEQGDSVTYTLRFLGTGTTLTLTDTLPSGTSFTGLLSYDGPGSDPAYDAGQHRLTWSGAPDLGREVTIRYAALIDVGATQELVNVAQLTGAGGGTSTDQAVVIANPRRVYLPVITKQH